MRELRGFATVKFTLERNSLNRKKTVEEGISEQRENWESMDKAKMWSNKVFLPLQRVT